MPTNIEFLHADQIGGCVTLISTDTTKICIDFGEKVLSIVLRKFLQTS